MHISSRKLRCFQRLRVRPLDLIVHAKLKFARLPIKEIRAQGNLQVQLRISAHAVAEMRARAARDAKFLLKLALQAGCVRFACFHLAAGKLPEPFVLLPRRAACQQRAPIADNDRADHALNRHTASPAMLTPSA